MDQFNNAVDKEVWVPLRANDWIDKVQIGSAKDGSQKPKFPMPVPLKTWTEFSIAYADGSIGDIRYKQEGEARQELQELRRYLQDVGVPEEYWPALMERQVEIIATSWKILNV